MDIIRDITEINFGIFSNRKIKYIVIHYTGAKGSAANNAKYFKSVDRNASAHYFVDEKEIVQVVEDFHVAWHCGSHNGLYKHNECRNVNSIGIEICCFEDAPGSYKMKELAIRKAHGLVKELMLKYNIPKENILRHYDVTGKKCPMEWAYDNCTEWEVFINA